jgi:hypothetical protein
MLKKKENNNLKPKRMKPTIKEIWKNRTQIMEGIKNSIIRDRFVEEIAAARMEHCNACVRKDVKGDDCAVPGTQPCCQLCGCSLKFKVRSLSSDCPDLRWKAVISEEDEDKLDTLN